MVDLDVPQDYGKLDPADMLGQIRELPQQCEHAWRSVLNLDLPSDYLDVDKVVILGMGGSAIGGDLLASLAAADSAVPVWVHRDYDLPPFVDARTLIIASSYSGLTEEVLCSFGQALATPAKKLALASGGRLREIAEEHGVPVFVIDYLGQPRAALAHSFIPLVGILQKLGLLPDKSNDVAQMVGILRELSAAIDANSPLRLNPAKQLAIKLFQRLVVIYGAGILADVARRWKTQINENGKSWAFYELFPELNHNAVVGYEFPNEMAGRMFVVLLRSRSLHPRTLARYQLTGEILAQRGISYQMVEASGESLLSQMMSLVLFGDYVSYYLALLYGADPSPVKAIDFLKRRLNAT